MDGGRGVDRGVNGDMVGSVDGVVEAARRGTLCINVWAMHKMARWVARWVAAGRAEGGVDGGMESQMERGVDGRWGFRWRIGGMDGGDGGWRWG